MGRRSSSHRPRSDGSTLAIIDSATASQALSTAESRRRRAPGPAPGNLSGAPVRGSSSLTKKPWDRSMPASLVSVRSSRARASARSDQPQPLGGQDTPEVRADVRRRRVREGPGPAAARANECVGRQPAGQSQLIERAPGVPGIPEQGRAVGFAPYLARGARRRLQGRALDVDPSHDQQAQRQDSRQEGSRHRKAPPILAAVLSTNSCRRSCPRQA